MLDFANQIAQSAVGKGMTAFFLGLTLGAGGLGAGAARGFAAELEVGEGSAAALRALKVARVLVWTDRVAFGIQALGFVLDDLRDRLPSYIVDAVHIANRIQAYYGWARMGEIASAVAARHITLTTRRSFDSIPKTTMLRKTGASFRS
jgi:hypothetical protein